ncbi:MAG: hypothetical protein H9W81_13505 [Enterococcus sp.]|nr:hypothetical protein [Enterococcus sp.]
MTSDNEHLTNNLVKIEEFHKPDIAHTLVGVSGGGILIGCNAGLIMEWNPSLIPAVVGGSFALGILTHLFALVPTKKKFLNKVARTLEINDKSSLKALGKVANKRQYIRVAKGKYTFIDPDASRWVEEGTYLLKDGGLWRVEPSNQQEAWDENLSDLKSIYNIQEITSAIQETTFVQLKRKRYLSSVLDRRLARV